MELIDELSREHAGIEAVALALVAFGRADEASAAPDELGRFLRFFRVFAGRFHHGREEQVLFPALVRFTEAPADRGPIASLLQDHRALDALLGELEREVAAAGRRVLAERYATALLHHIDAETSVLFPEARARFRRVSAPALADRAPDAKELAARDDGLRLVERWGTAARLDLVRGEGCVCCPAMGVRCEGVEREWSSDAEWHDMLDRIG